MRPELQASWPLPAGVLSARPSKLLPVVVGAPPSLPMDRNLLLLVLHSPPSPTPSSSSPPPDSARAPAVKFAHGKMAPFFRDSIRGRQPAPPDESLRKLVLSLRAQ